MPHNIEKSAFRFKEYVGYGRSQVWRIRREGKLWHAWSPSGNWERAATLAALSDLIA